MSFLSKESALFGVGGGVVAIVIFLVVYGQQDAKREVKEEQLAVQQAKHDRNLARAMGWQDQVQLEQAEVDAASARLAAARERAAQKQAQAEAKLGEIEAGLQAEVKVASEGRIDLDAALARINNGK